MNLLEAMNVEYSLSKKWLSASLVLTSFSYACLVAAALNPGTKAKWLTFAAFVTQLLIAWTRLRGGEHYSLGESVRRPAILQNGLGIKFSAIQFAKIAAKHGISFSGEPITFDKYYESKSPEGTRRLLEITEESAFWTGELAERMGALLRRVLILVASVSVLVAVAALQAGFAATRGEIITRVFIATITAWCIGDLFLLWRKYDTLGRAVQRVLADCEAALARDEFGVESAVILGEYNCSLAAAPVLPNFIYKINRDRLNIAWASRNTQEPAKADSF